MKARPSLKFFISVQRNKRVLSAPQNQENGAKWDCYPWTHFPEAGITILHGDNPLTLPVKFFAIEDFLGKHSPRHPAQVTGVKGERVAQGPDLLELDEPARVVMWRPSLWGAVPFRPYTRNGYKSAVVCFKSTSYSARPLSPIWGVP